MNPERLLQHFDEISEAPDAVPRLRRFILDLAVRGKLVEQDPTDEPAGALVRRIQVQRTAASQDVLPPTENSDFLFPLPAGWVTVTLGLLMQEGGKSIDPAKHGATEFCLWSVPSFASGKPEIVKGDDIGSSKRQIELGVILLAKINPHLNRIWITSGYEGLPQICSSEWLVLKAYDNAKHLLRYFLTSDFFLDQFCSVLSGIGGSLTRVRPNDAKRYLVPIPPLAEQHRIVAKVDEVMALCDELETAQTQRETRRDRLVASTLHGLNNGDAAPGSAARPSFKESARFYFNHLPQLTTRPEHIKQLRQTILNLAVRGKLVPQDPTDEPAAELLKRIVSERAGLEGQLKTKKPLSIPEIDKTDIPFLIPATWSWVRLIDILIKLTDGTHHSPPNSEKGDFMYVTAKNIKPEGVSLAGITYVSEEFHNAIFARCNPAKGDILYVKDGATTGVVTINNLDEPFCMLSSVALLKTPDCIYNQLLLRFLRSPFFYAQMRGFMKGAAITRITLKRMAPALIPLPPLAEQHRIVAKVDELMALCDELDAQIHNDASTRRRLLEAVLHEALNDSA